MSFTMYSSRSATELAKFCPRARYLRHHYKKVGIVAIPRSVPLATGTSIHYGIAILLRAIKLERVSFIEPNAETARVVEFAVAQARLAYAKEVEFDGFKPEEAPDQAYTLEEQSALTEALVRAWAMVEAPYIQRDFRVVAVEKDLPLTVKWSNTPSLKIIYPTRADAILEEKADSRIYVYSLKSCKSWDERIQNSYRIDLQGKTELLGLMEALKPYPDKLAMVAGVRYCFLVKGDRKPTKEGQLEQICPLIAGYTRTTAASVDFAWSWYFPNSANNSGVGALGRGWSKVKVWRDYPGGVSGWLELLANGEIQPDVGNPLKLSVIHPLPSYRDDKSLQECFRQVSALEERIGVHLPLMVRQTAPSIVRNVLDSVFPKVESHCHWFFRFGGQGRCEYYPICHEGLNNPLEMGFKLRVPHHVEEAEYWRKEGVIE